MLKAVREKQQITHKRILIMIIADLSGCQHRLSGQEFEQTLGGSKGQGSLACCSPCRHSPADRLHRRLTRAGPLGGGDSVLQARPFQAAAAANSQRDRPLVSITPPPSTIWGVSPWPRHIVGSQEMLFVKFGN